MNLDVCKRCLGDIDSVRFYHLADEVGCMMVMTNNANEQVCSANFNYGHLIEMMGLRNIEKLLTINLVDDKEIYARFKNELKKDMPVDKNCVYYVEQLLEYLNVNSACDK